MSGDAGERLKLTAYFGERDRADGRLVADALIDLYARHEVESSLLMRGVTGFGLRHHLRTDRLLTLSEDLPAVAVAVDRAPAIEALLEEVLRLRRHGLLSLERARRVGGSAGPLAAELGDELKLTMYLGRGDRADGEPAFLAACEVLHRAGVGGATALLGVDGTVRGQRRRGRFLGRNGSVPMMIVAVGRRQPIEAALPELTSLAAEATMTIERVRVCKRDGRLLQAPTPLPATDAGGLGLWQKLTVFTSEARLADGRPAHQELVRRLRRDGVAGATSLRGVWGFHGDHGPHGDRLLQLRRRAPILTSVIDRPDRIRRGFELADELTPEHGLITVETVPAMYATAAARERGGLRLARPHG
ncbi:MAG: DUF190 domain-containing protein [Solirubrobacterales bacterium]